LAFCEQQTDEGLHPRMIYRCKICLRNGDYKTWLAQEKMFGWGDSFEYIECEHCGCVQIREVPANLGRYYPPNYYSFHLQPYPTAGLRRWIAGRRDRYAATGRGILGRLMANIRPARTDVASLGAVAASLDARILDLGCGRGQLLTILHRAGFRNIQGVDPFLEHDVEVLPGLYVRKKRLSEVEESFDVIMLHHVIEHLENPAQILADCRLKLSPGGKIILRYPTADSHAWEHYRQDWVQLDAPRHLFLHTRASIEILAQSAGLKIERLWCDSSYFQFTGSELYRRGIPLAGDKAGSHTFTKKELQRYSAEAKRLNKLGRGDQVVAVLGPGTRRRPPLAAKS
jgi:SAM-dependent methyltransferase